MHAGVYLLFDGHVISNNSVIDVDKEERIRIFCYTNNTDCCRDSNTGGNWYFPNGELVLSKSASEQPTFLLSRRTEYLLLYANGFGAMERGQFLCQIPNANDKVESIYIRLCEL